MYALLDPQSDTCFVKTSVLQDIGLDGEEVTLEEHDHRQDDIEESSCTRFGSDALHGRD